MEKPKVLGAPEAGKPTTLSSNGQNDTLKRQPEEPKKPEIKSAGRRVTSW